MINIDDVATMKKYYPNQPQIPDYPYRMLIIGGSGSEGKNSVFHLINHQPDAYIKFIYMVKINIKQNFNF